MGQYRKSDQYYIDRYDRMTIARLKELEQNVEAAAPKFYIDPELKPGQSNTEVLSCRIIYLNAGVHYARNKRTTIEEWIRSDEDKDRKLHTYGVPREVACPACGTLMQFEMHDFLGDVQDLIFYFSCPKGHLPKRALYADGRERIIKKRSCTYCNGDLLTKTKKGKYKIVIKDTCKLCGKAEVFEYETKPETIPAIDETERKKYCTDFIGRRSFEEDLQAIASLNDIFEKEEIKKRSGFDRVQQLTIVHMERLLSEAVEKAGFMKLALEKPRTGRYLTVAFSVQDVTDRDAIKSVKALKEAVTKALFPTNWRLMSTDIDYKLGFLSGQLKGASAEDDLIKIAEEITLKSPK